MSVWNELWTYPSLRRPTVRRCRFMYATCGSYLMLRDVRRSVDDKAERALEDAASEVVQALVAHGLDLGLWTVVYHDREDRCWHGIGIAPDPERWGQWWFTGLYPIGAALASIPPPATQDRAP